MTNDEAMALGARCNLCPLRGKTIVPPAPAKRALRLVIVGESPGRTEEKLGQPFVGMSGQLLDNTLKFIGVSREECHITNVALCRGETDLDNLRAGECCTPRLLHELRQGESTPIVSLGSSALRSLLGLRSILVARGFVFIAPEIDSKKVKAAAKGKDKDEGEGRLKAATLEGRSHLAGRTVLPILHPAFILRSDSWNILWIKDWQRVGRLLSGRLPNPLEDAGTQAVGGLEVLSSLGDSVSLDVETDGIKTLETGLLCVGLSDGKNTGVIWPWYSAYASPLAEWLSRRTSVVIHNTMFDLLVLQAHGVIW